MIGNATSYEILNDFNEAGYEGMIGSISDIGNIGLYLHSNGIA